MKDVPSIVLEKAKFLLDRGGFVKYIGSSKDGDIYYGAIEDCDTGFPSVFIFDYCCPIKVRKGIPRGLNHRIEAVGLSIFDFQAPLLSKTPS